MTGTNAAAHTADANNKIGARRNTTEAVGGIRSFLRRSLRSSAYGRQMLAPRRLCSNALKRAIPPRTSGAPRMSSRACIMSTAILIFRTSGT